MAKACASHGSRNTGPCSSRGMPGNGRRLRGAPRPDRTSSQAGSRYGSKASTETVSVGSAFGAPELAAVEDHRVKPLRILALRPS